MFIRLVSIVLALFIVTAGAAWLGFPWWLPRLAAGIDAAVTDITVTRPGPDGLRIESARYDTGTISARITQATMTWRFRDLFRGEIDAIDIKALDVEVASFDTSAEGNGQQPALPELWQLVPARRIAVDTLEIRLPAGDPEGKRDRITGNATFSPDELAARLTLTAGRLPDPVRLEARITPAGGGTISVSFSDRPLISAKVTIDPSSVFFHGSIDVPEIETLLPFVRSFVQVPGTWQGSISGPVDGRLPIGGRWQSAKVHGSLQVEGKGSVAGAEGIEASGTGRVLLNADTLSIDVRDIEMRATVIRDYPLTPDSRLTGTFSAVFPDLANLSLETVSVEASLEADVVTADPDAQRLAFRGPLRAAGTLAETELEFGASTTVSIPVGNDRLALTLETPMLMKFSGQRVSSTESTRARVDLPALPVAGQSIDIDAGRLRLDALKLDFKTAPAFSASGDFSPTPARDAIVLAFRVDGDMAGPGTFEASIDHDIEQTLLDGHLPGWSMPVDLTAGRLEANLGGGFDLTKADLGLTATGSVGVNRGVGHYENSNIEGLDAALPVRIEGADWQLGPGDVDAAIVNVGIAMTDLDFILTVGPEQARLANLSIAVFGGRAKSETITWGMEQGEASFDIELEGLSLKQILSIEGYDIAGTGTLDGRLPIRLTASGFSIDAGSVSSRPPGGGIAYDSGFGDTDAPGLGIAMRALRDFNYEQLRGTVSYEPDGALELGLDLRGRSPNVESGRPIHFNLTISENLKDLLRSLRAAQRMNERIQREFSQ